MNILMPMAGEGTRIKHLHPFPKPLVPVAGKPMFYWPLQAAGKVNKYIFVVQQKHVDEFKIDMVLRSFYADCVVVVQDGRVNGPVASTLLAKDHITASPLLIMDCDMFTTFNYEKIYAENPEVGVVTFSSASDQYSYVKPDGRVVEKQVVSDNAVAGSFYWSNGLNYVSNAEKSIASGDMVNGEVYVSSVINRAVDSGLSVSTYKSFEAYDLSTNQGAKEFVHAFH